ncbi:MAG: ABC transporter ATP-binding protein [Chloroflexi bacterium]|nr:ABC transporter ATP-binding protein [Chloroflexota bacterium]
MTGVSEVAEASAPAALKATGITKRFGHRLVLKGINFSLAQGERVAIFGPNGAGKTTLMRILATVAAPTNGQVVVDGIDPQDDPLEARRRIGVVSHHPYLYDDLTARENLRFYGRMYDVPELERRIAETVGRVGLSARLDDRVGTFSHGMQQRIAMARAVLHDPEVLMLDEPEAGLDQDALDLLSDLLKEPQEGRRRAALIVTHHLDLGLALSDRVAILVEGRIVLQTSSAELDPGSVRQLYSRHASKGIRNGGEKR